jgi:hypothetical protein
VGALLCAATADRLRGTISVGLLVVFPHLYMAAFIAGRELLADNPAAAAALHLGVAGTLALVGGLPPLIHLRRR